MELIAHPAQGSYLSVHLRPHSWCNKQKVSYCLASHLFHGSDKRARLNHHHQWRIQPVISKKGKSFKVSSFKGNPCNGGEETTHRASRLTKKTVQLSHSEKEREETLAESSDLVNRQVAVPAEDQEDIAGSPAIQRLFKKWLVLLRTQAPVPAKEEICEDENKQNEMIDAHPVKQGPYAGSLLKAMVLRFWALDATLKIPLLIFPPSYLAITLRYGSEVVQELMPLWVAGPLIVAMYIQMVRYLCSLYILCWKKSGGFLTFGPRICIQLISYIVKGKVVADFHRLIWQPIVDLKSMDYKELYSQKKDELKEWATEKWLDYIEYVWPYYCRTIRFLKKANLL